MTHEPKEEDLATLFVPLAKLAASQVAPLRGLRQLVSGSKMRFQREGYDLDLTYVLPRLIALGLPAYSALEQIYRNPISEVRSFLDHYHGQRYAIVNLCDERDYADVEFPLASVLRYPFPDHHPPALPALYNFCVWAYQYLRRDEANVVAVHCKAGKGRTGVMICSYLLYIKQPGCPDADSAVRFFRSRRTTDGNAIVKPSQVRYVRYFQKLLSTSILDRDRRIRGDQLTLVGISLSAAPSAIAAAEKDAFQTTFSAVTNTLARAWSLRIDVSSCTV